MRWTVVVATILMAGEARADLMRSPDGKETRDVPTESVPYATKDGWTSVPTVMMRSPSGTVVDVYEPYVDEQLARGFWKMTDSEIADYQAERMQRIADSVKERAWYEKPSNLGVVLIIVVGGIAVLAWLARGIVVDRGK